MLEADDGRIMAEELENRDDRAYRLVGAPSAYSMRRKPNERAMILGNLFSRTVFAITIVDGKCKLTKGKTVVSQRRLEACDRILDQMQVYSGTIRGTKGKDGIKVEFSSHIGAEEQSQLRHILRKIKID